MHRLIALAAGLVLAFGLMPAGGAADTAAEGKRYNVVLAGSPTAAGWTAENLAGVRAAVSSAGGSIELDLAQQIGALVVESANPLFAQTLRATGLVEDVAEDFKWKAYPSRDEALASGAMTVVQPGDVPGGGPDPHSEGFEALQWDMRQIQAPLAHGVQAGSRLVQVGILDTGISGNHVDFADTDGSNVDCALGRDFIPAGPGVGTPDPCLDNNFHGTHVAGIVGARANGVGVVGVAPNVTLVPVKVCDAAGYCYASSTAAGITYAGDAKLEVINMSFFVDDDMFLQSTEFKCMSDPVQRTFRTMNERAIQYARDQGVVPVAALGNSDNDLAHPPEPYENDCEVVPAETQGVIGTAALGRLKEKALYSNYGSGPTDVAAPGGNPDNPETPGPCENDVFNTFPNDLYGCISGTSMASPHAAGVAALIVSEFGHVGTDAGEQDVVMRPSQVASYLESTVVDQGLPGYDECFGHGRIDAFRAVTHDTSRLYDGTAPNCPEYSE